MTAEPDAPIVLTAETVAEAEHSVALIRRYLTRRPLGPESATSLLLGDLLEALHRYRVAQSTT